MLSIVLCIVHYCDQCITRGQRGTGIIEASPIEPASRLLAQQTHVTAHCMTVCVQPCAVCAVCVCVLHCVWGCVCVCSRARAACVSSSERACVCICVRVVCVRAFVCICSSVRVLASVCARTRAGVTVCAQACELASIRACGVRA